MTGPRTAAAEALHAMKYRGEGEDFREAMNRVSFALKDSDPHYHELREVLLDMRFLPPGRVQSAMGSKRQTTPYNCFVSGTVEDSFVEGEGSIMQRAHEAAATMRMGGGIGYDFSTLRPRGDMIRRLQSIASGPVSFMNIFNEVGLVTASSGHRRGAQMAVMRIDHPDIEEFIRVKQNKTRLTGFNISVAVTDEFMEAVAAGKEFDLRWGGKVYTTIDARELWEAVMRSTWDWAEPGVLFIDRINEMNNLWYCETIAATNPCFTGDTKVWTAYGPKSFSELAESGEEIPVLTQLDDGRLVYRDMTKPRKTRRDAELIEVTVRGSGRKAGSQTTFRCTPNHIIFLRDGSKKAAKDLQPGDRIASVYRRIANQKSFVMLSGSHEQVFEHYVACEYTEGRRPDYPLEHAHHKDGDRSNNFPGNVEIKEASLHNSEHMLGNDNPMRRFPERCHFLGKESDGDKNSHWRDDVDTAELLRLREAGLSFKKIADKIGCSKYLVMNRLGWTPKYQREQNHTVVSVSCLKEKEDVYCGTVKATGRFFIVTGENEGVLVSNCGEQPLPPFGACLLGSFNLPKYLLPTPSPRETSDPAWSFDFDLLEADIPVVVRAMDNVADRARYPLARQKSEAVTKRRMGLGVTGLANAGEALGYPYGSQEFIEFTGKVLSIIRDRSYEASARLAAEKGAFPMYEGERYLQGKFIRTLPDSVRALIKKHGIRNSHLTSIAPTGTISLCADNVSSGLEPVIYHSAERKINTPTGSELVVVEDYGTAFLNVRGRLAEDVSPREHVAVLCAAQKFVDSAVSKTCNVDEGASYNEFKELYRLGYDGGAKGLTTYKKGGMRESIMTSATKDDDQVPEGATCEFDPLTGRKECG